jgi:hydrogenase maturation protein HypF
VAHHDWVVPSHHIGDLEHLATYRSFVQAIGHLSALYGVTPDVVVHDLHPEYLSSKFAAELDLPAIAVQHHHAHVASCMVEHGRTEAVLGIAFDGLGYGADGTLWGGELMIADLVSFRRVGHVRPAPMPGGVNAIREPWRMGAVWSAASSSASVSASAASTWAAGAEDRSAIARLFPGIDEQTVTAVLDLADRATTPVTTSVGRLFDAVAALLGCRTHVSYEAQAAIELEAMARTIPRSAAPRYEGTVLRTRVEGLLQLDPAPLVAALLTDLGTGVAGPVVAAGFHEALGRSATDAAVELAGENGLDTVVLTGGVFQNERLSAIMEDGLQRAGLRVLSHAEVPANDGGISVGQAAIAAFA